MNIRVLPSRLVMLGYLGLFLGALYFYSRHNDFPITYHPDEKLKGAQIITGALNFHHPLMLLDTADLFLRVSGLPRTEENAVFCGRWASAVFTALAVVVLTMLAGRRAGWAGALIAAPVIGLHPLLYELAHYCKEDPALLLGISLTMLALDVFSVRPSWKTAAWLGAACGVAASGKYLGLLMLPVVIPWVIRQSTWRTLLPVFVGGFLGSFLLFNFPFLLHIDTLWAAFDYEFKAAQIGGAKGLTRDVPHGKYIDVFFANIGWPIWIGLVCFAATWFWRRKTRQANDLVCLLLPIAYAVLLSFSPKTANRYFLAVSPLLLYCGSIGMVWFTEPIVTWKPLLRWERWLNLGQKILLPALAVLAIVVQARLTLPYSFTFRDDSRMEMAAWISANLPQGSSLVSETRVGLLDATTWKLARPRPDLQIQQTVFAPDLGTFEEMQKRGVRYVAVIRTGFGGYLSKGRKPSPNQESLHKARSTFYQTLFDRSKLLKKCGGKGVGHLNPEIRIYEIPPL